MIEPQQSTLATQIFPVASLSLFKALSFPCPQHQPSLSRSISPSDSSFQPSRNSPAISLELMKGLLENVVFSIPFGWL